MEWKATAEQLSHAEAWLRARGISLEEMPIAGGARAWCFGELPDAVRIILDTNYAEGDEATFDSRVHAINALAETLGQFADACRIPN